MRWWRGGGGGREQIDLLLLPDAEKVADKNESDGNDRRRRPLISKNAMTGSVVSSVSCDGDGGVAISPFRLYFFPLFCFS